MKQWPKEERRAHSWTPESKWCPAVMAGARGPGFHRGHRGGILGNGVWEEELTFQGTKTGNSFFISAKLYTNM
jgi:hypothetical protein